MPIQTEKNRNTTHTPMTPPGDQITKLRKHLKTTKKRKLLMVFMQEMCVSFQKVLQ